MAYPKISLSGPADPKLGGHDAPDVTVIGAGLAGLATAFELARLGVDVEVCSDPDDTVEATKACHGISTIKGILESDAELFAIKLEGHRGFSSWLSEVESVAQVSRPAAVWLEGVSEDFRTHTDFRQEFGRIYRRDFIGAKRVILDRKSEGAFARAYYPGDWWIDPTYLVATLKKALEAMRVELKEVRIAKVALTQSGPMIFGEGGGQPIHRRAIIIAAGAKTGHLLGRSGLKMDNLYAVPGYTFKGRTSGPDLCMVKGTSGATSIAGELHWGSTSDDALAISEDLRLQTLRKLEPGAETLLAARHLESIGVQSHPILDRLDIRWGVRVRTRSRAPLVKKIPCLDGSNLWVNTGYYKSGIILSWLMARRLAPEVASVLPTRN